MTDDLMKNLKASSKKWATAITKEANRNLGKFKKLIKVTSETVDQSGKVGIISTAIAKGKNKKGIVNPPVARAYEYGSGIRSRSKKKSPHQGEGGFIIIKPKRKKFLAFSWEKAISDPRESKFIDGKGKIYQGGKDAIPSGAKILLRSVKHPGVEAANGGRGYLAPAIAKIRKTMINKELPKDVRKAVLGSIKKGFKGTKQS